MNKVCVILVVMFFNIPLIMGQSNNQLDSLINESFISFVMKQKEYQKKGIINDEYFKNLYFLADNLPRSFQLCKQLQDMGFGYFTLTNPNTKSIKKGKEHIVVFCDILLKNNQLNITLSDKRVTLLKNNHWGVATSDWGDYIYEFSCETQKWILVETKYGGI